MLSFIGIVPAISETGIVLDAGECGIDIAEFLADALDESAHIGAESDFAGARHEALPMHDVVELAIAHVMPCARHQMIDDLKFGLGQFEADVLPEGTVGVAAQLQIAMLENRRRRGGGLRRLAAPSGPEDVLKAVQQYREAAGFFY